MATIKEAGSELVHAVEKDETENSYGRTRCRSRFTNDMEYIDKAPELLGVGRHVFFSESFSGDVTCLACLEESKLW